MKDLLLDSKRFYGYEIIDPNHKQDFGEYNQPAIFALYEKLDCPYYLTGTGISSKQNQLTLEQSMKIRESADQIHSNLYGELIVVLDNGSTYEIAIEPDSTFEEICSAIEDAHIENFDTQPF